MDEDGVFTDAAGPELENKAVLEEGTDVGRCYLLIAQDISGRDQQQDPSSFQSDCTLPVRWTLIWLATLFTMPHRAYCVLFQICSSCLCKYRQSLSSGLWREALQRSSAYYFCKGRNRAWVDAACEPGIPCPVSKLCK